jgi:FdhE protein
METQARKIGDVEKKINRIRQVKAENPLYGEMLDFLEPVVRERLHYKSLLLKTIGRPKINDAGVHHKLQNGVPLIDRSNMQFDPKLMAAHVKTLLDILQPRSPQAADLAGDILKNNNYIIMAQGAENHSALGSAIAQGTGDILDFLVKETLSPVMEIYAEAFHPLLLKEQWENGYCPVCGEPPVMAMTAPDNGKRSLVCGGCATKWPFSRITCPFCGNTDQDRLSYLYLEHDDKYRIEVCDVCRHYIKTVDLRNMDRPMDFEVEDMITLHLDMIAMENGYTHPLRSGDPKRRSGERLN